MFGFIEYIVTFWHDLLTAINSFMTSFDLSLITFTIGTQSITLLLWLEIVLNISTVLLVVRITYSIIKKLGYTVRRLF